MIAKRFANIRAFSRLLLPVALLFLVFCALGTWQLQRQMWKTELLALIHERMTAPVVALPEPADWAKLDLQTYEYRHVSVSGIFLSDKVAFIPRPNAPTEPEGRPILQILMPLRLDNGALVFIDRGNISTGEKAAFLADLSQNRQVSIQGVIRVPEKPGIFTPVDQPQRQEFFTRNPDRLAKALGLGAVAPFLIDADLQPARSAHEPHGGDTIVSLPNNHLAYALTWFALALLLILATIAIVVRSE